MVTKYVVKLQFPSGGKGAIVCDSYECVCQAIKEIIEGRFGQGWSNFSVEPKW